MDRRIRNSSSRINPLARFVPLCALLFFGHANSLVASTGISLVQHKGKDGGTNTTASVAFSSQNTAGNFIAVAIRGGLSSSQVFTVKDSNGNIYKKAVQIGFTSSAVTSAIYYAENIKSGANTITVSMTVSAPLRFAVLEYSGVATSNSLDATAAATGTGTIVSSGTATTTINGDLLFGSASTVNGATYTAGTGYTIRDSVPSGAGAKFITEDRIQASAGTASATATLAASDGWGALLAAFKPAGGVAAPSITSLNPTSGPVGTSVTITGLNFGASQGTSTVTFNGNAATPTSWSATSIVVPVPNAATTGNVIVTVSGVASNGALFTVIVPPSITNLSPTFAPLGASVTITGSNFGASQGTSTVTFNGVAATPTSWSTTSITAPVPSGATTGNVIVTVSGLASNGVAFGVAPSINSISPTSGPIGTSVTITGTSFGATQGTSTVTFGPNTATPTSWSNTTIIAPVPAGATTGNVIVMVNGIGSNRVLFTVTPAITSLNPTSGPVGTSVTITGTNFGPTQGTSTITLNGTQLPVTSWTSTSIATFIPVGAATGNVVVTVGGLASNGVLFTVTPSINSVSPTSGPAGTSVTIAGANFGSTQGTSSVMFGSSAASVTSWSNTSIVAIVPSNLSPYTNVNVQVTVSGASASTIFSITPNITSLSPTVGPAGTSVTITGTNFTLTQGNNTVTFNGAPATPTSWGPTSIVVPVPAGATTGNVVVTVNGFASNAVAFTVLPTPSIASLSPTSGPLGTSVTITGTNFGSSQGTSTITFSSAPAIPTSWSATSIIVPVPSGATTGNVVVTVGGVASNGVGFTVIPPNIASLSLSSGAIGTPVTITGTNFGAIQGTSVVRFNGTVAPPVSWSDTSIVVPVPSGATTGNIVVTVGALSSNGVLFTVTAPPNITNLSPTTGSVGTPVTIAGSNFGPTQGSSTVTFNGTAATPTSWSSTGIVVPVPVGATTGNVVVTVNGLSSNGSPFTVNAISVRVSPTTVTLGTGAQQIFSLTVQNDTQGNGAVTWSLSGQACTGTACGTIQPFNAAPGEIYTAPATAPSPSTVTLTATSVTDPTKSATATITVVQATAPNITSLSPSSGPLGSSVVIAGTNFGNTQGSSVVWFSSTQGAVTSWSNTSIVATVPTSLTGNANALIQVVVLGLASNQVNFSITPAPSITSLNPGTGPVGSTVTIVGNNFGATQGTSTIMFNGVPATPSSWSATSIVVSVPAAATTGNVVVTVGVVASNGLTFTLGPDITPPTAPSNLVAGTSPGLGIHLSWTLSTDNVGVANYLIEQCQGAGCTNFTQNPPIAGNIFPFVTIGPLSPGTSYSFRMRAKDAAGNASSYSNIASAITDPMGITNLSPNSGPVGTSVTVFGGGFGATQGTSNVTFNGTVGSPTSWSDTSITVPVPAGATSGNVVVTVGAGASNGVPFTVIPSSPNITSLSPTSGLVGAAVTITGSAFGASQGTSAVTFNGTVATPTSWSATSIVVPVPSGATTGNVIVTVSGQASNGFNFTVTLPPPNISNVSPASGPVGTSITLTGVNFGASQGTSTVTVGGAQAVTTSWSDTIIVATVPPTASGGATAATLFVTVSNQVSNVSSFTIIPSIASLSPASGSTGSSVTITGSGFGASQASSTVTFNGSAATITNWSATSIAVTVPGGATSGNVVVTVGGFASNGVTFTITPPPTMTSMTPSSAVVGGGPLTLTVNGTNFASSSIVQWNGNALPTTFLSSTQLQATVTSTNLVSLGAAKVTVSNASVGGGVSNASTFFVGATGGSNFAAIVVNQATQDIVYDAKNQVFYLSVPATSSTYANTIVVLDPTTAAVTSVQSTGNDPNILAISDDNQFLYAGIDGTSIVERFVLPVLAPDIIYSLGSDPNLGPYVALDLQVAPGAPHTSAVTLGAANGSPRAIGGVAIFDDSTPRPTKTPGFGGTGLLFDSLQWGADARTLFASNTESTGYDFYTLAVNPSGVTVNQDFPGTFTHFGANIHFDPRTNLVYSDDGHAINPTTGLPFGNFNTTGAMAADGALNMAFFASTNSSSNTTIASFDLIHFTPINTATIANVSGTPLHLIRWGQNGLAFISKAANGTSQVVLLGGDFVSATPSFVVTPPPAPVVPPVPAPNAPTIASLNPSSVIWPNSRFVLNVIGTQFDPAATVLLNGTGLSTTYVSSTQLQAQVPPGSVVKPGTASVVVANPPASGGNSTSATLFVGSSGGTSSTGTGFAFQVVNQVSNQIAFDPASQRLYLSVPNSATTGNTIAVLDPGTATIIGQQYAGSNPNALTISDDGQFLYAGIDGSSSVQRFILPGLAPDIGYPLGSDQFLGPYFAQDLQVAPAAPHTTAVTLGNYDTTTPADGGIAIWDDTTPRVTKAAGVSNLYSSIQWGADTTALFAANDEGSGFDFYSLSVTSSGVSLVSDYPNAFSVFHNRIHFDRGANLVYSDDGHVVVPSTGASAGTFPITGLVSPVMVPDSSLDLAFFATQTGSSAVAIYSYNLTTLAPVSSILFSGVHGNPVRIIRWGQNGLAFNTDAGQIVLVGGNFVH